MFTKVSIIVVLSIIVPLILSCQSKNEQMNVYENATDFKNQRASQLSNLLSKHDFESSFMLIDSILAVYPDDPQMYLALGWIYDIQGDINMASKHYDHAICIYDSLLHERKQYSDEINRAFVYQLKEGPEVYIRILDSISTLPEYKSDSPNIEGYKHFILQHKEDLFRPDGAEMTPTE